MPPKKKSGEKEKKAQEKARVDARRKVVEDKTFGLKNKNKSSRVQKHIQTLHNTVDPTAKTRQQAQETKKEKKKQEEEFQKELDGLFKAAYKQPKIPIGVDPKSVVCEAFRHGQCTKGFKCKFSHDLNLSRKGPKIDIYSDRRDAENEETMEDWDQNTLEDVVQKKHGQENKGNQTNIICKYFLEAVEKKQYGWFWKCPNGDKCIYRHALPPGYVLKSQMKELLEAETKTKQDISEEIEEERRKVQASTPITEEVFKQWHEKKTKTKKDEEEKAEAERRKKGILNGRELFLQQGFTAMDDTSAADSYEREVDDEAEIQKMTATADAEYKRAKELAQGTETATISPPESAPSDPEPSNSAAPCTSSGAGASTTLQLNEEEEQLFLEDDEEDELNEDELKELAKQVLCWE